ncbi:hypothetical protein Aperf_G00000092833 [Anoplocephala perfoliata]
MFEVNIKTLDGDSKTFQIDDEDLTVSAFKEKIAAEMNIPIDRQRLIFQGKVLVDEKKLKDCGVESKTVHLVPRPPPQPNTEGSPSTSHRESHHAQTPPITPDLPGLRGAMNSILSSLPNLNFPPPGPSSNLSTGQVANRLFSSLQRQATNLLNTIDGVSVPGSTTPSENQTTSEAGTSAPQSQDTTPTPEAPPPPVDFGRLADMAAEQRNLWQRLGQHLDRWEAMLRSEHEVRRSNQTPEDHAPVPSSGSPAEPMDTSDAATHVAWSDSFFDNVSAALHLHAHMLHLFSEFCISPRASAVTSSSVSGDAEATSEATSNPPSRTLIINEPIANILHAHINIEPTVVTIARPVVNVSREASEASTRRRSQSANPPVVNEATTTTTPVSVGTQSAESESATARSGTATPSAAGGGGTGGAFNVPTTVVFDTPLLGGQTPSAITAQLFETIYSHMGEPMHQTASAAQQPQTGSDTSTPQVAASTPPNSRRRAIPRIRNTTSSGSTNDPRRQFPPLVLPPRFGLAGEDIFLPCSSRHFLGRSGSMAPTSVTISGGRARQRRSLVGPTAAAVSATAASRRQGGLGSSTLRRGRSAGAHLGGTPATATSSGQNVASATEALSTVRNILNTVTTAATTAMSAAENFGDATSGQLGQILAEFGVTSDGTTTTSSTNTDGGSSSDGGSVTTGPFGWIFTPSRVGGFEFFIPSHGSGSTSSIAVTNTRLTAMPEILIDGLIRSMWCAIYRIAHAQIPESLPSVAIDAWGSGSSQYPFNRYADDSRVRPLISFLVGSLHEVTSQLTEDNFETLIRHAVDRSRPLVQRLLNDNLQEGDSVVRPDLANFLLNSFPTDESNFPLPDSLIFAWTTARAAEVGNDPLDIRRSLHNFFMGSLLRQMPLWRDTGSNGTLGTVILNSLNVIMVELLGFCHLLVQRAVELLGLRLNASTTAVAETTGSVGEAERIATFGHSLSFEPMAALLRDFNSNLPEESPESAVMGLIMRGVDAVMNEFLANGVSRFNENRGRLLSYLETRPLPPSRSPTVRTNPPASNVKVDGIEDSDSEIYMDATEDSPSLVIPSGSTSAPAINSEAAVNEATYIFPDWGTQEVPLSSGEALAPNPQSTWRPPPPSINRPQFPAAFPSEWTDIVASDAVQMSSTVPVDTIGLENATSGSDNAAPFLRRLSDAYIAGMPVKRRRVMLEYKHNLTCSSNEMFMNILKEAMSASPLPVASPAGPTEIATTGDVAVAEANPSLSQLSPPHHVSEAFRAYVTEHLSRRLANDPDFDARRYPAAGEAFGRRDSPSSSSNQPVSTWFEPPNVRKKEKGGTKSRFRQINQGAKELFGTAIGSDCSNLKGMQRGRLRASFRCKH